MDALEGYRRSVQRWRALVSGVADAQWEEPTPDDDWDVRALVNHVVGEDRWTVPLLRGRTIADVGDALDGDLLGADPRAAADLAAQEAVAAFAEPGAVNRTVHLSYGDEAAEEYAWQLVADHAIHGWDLAVATGQDATIDPDLVAAIADWFTEREALYREGGAIAARVETAADADPQTRLLAAFGRDADWTPA